TLRPTSTPWRLASTKWIPAQFRELPESMAISLHLVSPMVIAVVGPGPDPGRVLPAGMVTLAPKSSVATPAPLASCRAPIVSHECRRVRFCRRGAGLARCAHRLPTPSRAEPMGRPAGHWEHSPHAWRAGTPDPGRSVRVADQLRRRTRDRG